MSSSDELIKNRINLSKKIVENICRNDDINEQQKAKIDAWFNSLPSNNNCNIEINSDLYIRLEFYQDMYVKELITINLTKNQIISKDKSRFFQYRIINGKLDEIRQVSTDRKEKIRDEVSLATFINREYSNEEVKLLIALIQGELHPFLHNSGYYRTTTRFYEWKGVEIDEQITSFDKNENGMRYNYRYKAYQEESSDIKYDIELMIEDRKAEINADIYIPPYNSQVISDSERIVIKMLPDKVLNEIKRQIKIAAEHGVDISAIPVELQPQQAQGLPTIQSSNNTVETPGAHGEGGSEPDL